MSIEHDASADALPRLSVVIPSVGRTGALATTLADLAAQRYPGRWEVIVVHQGPEGGGFDVGFAEKLGEALRIFHLREPNASLARNIGLREARGEVVLFLDDDVRIPNPHFLLAHAGHYRDARICGVAGQIRGPSGCVRMSRHPWSRHPSYGWLYFPANFAHRCQTRNGTSANLSVRRQPALDVGGMDAQFEKGAYREESDFCLRLTRRFGPLVFDPEAWLIHLGEPAGGSRTWGNASALHPLHHVAGEWYFILKGLRLGTIPYPELHHHLVALLRRQILNADNRYSPVRLLRACRRSLEGYRQARAKLRAGPRSLATLDPGCYRQLRVVGDRCVKED